MSGKAAAWHWQKPKSMRGVDTALVSQNRLDLPRKFNQASSHAAIEGGGGVVDEYSGSTILGIGWLTSSAFFFPDIQFYCLPHKLQKSG